MEDLTNNCTERLSADEIAPASNAAIGVCRLLTVMQGGKEQEAMLHVKLTAN